MKSGGNHSSIFLVHVVGNNTVSTFVQWTKEYVVLYYLCDQIIVECDELALFEQSNAISFQEQIAVDVRFCESVGGNGWRNR